MIMEGGRCEKPIIGILAQETNQKMNEELEKLNKNADSYIAASYVKAVESSGARVVPIFLDMPNDYYRNIIKSINGLLLPGGNTWFFEIDNVTPRSDGYPRAAEILYEEIKEINNKNEKSTESFPILGICLGFELLLFIDMGKMEYRGVCETIQSPLPLNFQGDIKNDKEINDCPVELFKLPVSYFSHRFYVLEETLICEKLRDKWQIVATAEEKERNIKYVSIIKSKKYPIIGLQFHPEKNAYEWKEKFLIPHDENAIKASRYFFDWLVKQSKCNSHKFENKEDELKSLIHNFPPMFTPKKFSFDEIYFFSKANI